MSALPPRFELTRVNADGSTEEPAVVPVTDIPADCVMDRRGFLGAGVCGTALLSLLGCGRKDPEPAPPKKTPATARAAAPAAPTSQVPAGHAKAHTQAVSALLLLRAGQLVSSSADSTAVLWDFQGMHRRDTYHHTAAVTALALLPGSVPGRPDEPLVATLTLAPEWQLRLFSWNPKQEAARWNAPRAAVGALAAASRGRLLAAGAPMGAIQLCSIEPAAPAKAGLRPGVPAPTGKLEARPLATLQGHSGEVQALVMDPLGTFLVSGSFDRTIRLWDLPSGRPLSVLAAHAAPVLALALSPDGKTLASGSRDGAVKLWDLTRGLELAELKGHTGAVHALAFTPDGKTLASGSEDRTVRLWRLPDGYFLTALKGHAKGVRALAASADGRLLAAGDESGAILVWNLADQRYHGALGTPAPSPSPRSYYPSSGGYRGGGTICTCNKVCTCIPVYRRR